MLTSTVKRHQIIIDPSTTTINDLTEDLLLEILNKLSPRTMGRAMAVSKTWLTLISTISIPALTASPPHALLYSAGTRARETRDQTLAWQLTSLKPDRYHATPLADLCNFLPFKLSHSDLLDCVDGFLLLFDHSAKHFYLCNPSIEHFAAFPNSPEDEDCLAAALYFDPLCRIAYICQGTRFTLRVFTIGRALIEEYDFDYQHPFGNQLLKRYVFSDGFLHVLAVDGYLMRFDMKQISVEAIELPKVVAKKHPIGGIATSQGRLHYTWDDDSKMMVWMLGQDERIHDWVLKYTIPYQYFVDHPLCTVVPNEPWFGVFAFDPVSDVLYVGSKNEIYRYDPCTNKVEKVCKINRKLSIFGWTSFVYIYTVNLSTLYSVCMGGE